MHCPNNRVCEIDLSLAGHFKLFAGHLIEFNYGSLPDIFKFRWTCPASPANFAYSANKLNVILMDVAVCSIKLCTDTQLLLALAS